MNGERYDQLMFNMDSELTKEEIKQGWHFCCDFDGLLSKKGGTGCFCNVFESKFKEDE